MRPLCLPFRRSCPIGATVPAASDSALGPLHYGELFKFRVFFCEYNFGVGGPFRSKQRGPRLSPHPAHFGRTAESSARRELYKSARACVRPCAECDPRSIEDQVGVLARAMPSAGAIAPLCGRFVGSSVISRRPEAEPEHRQHYRWSGCPARVLTTSERYALTMLNSTAFQSGAAPGSCMQTGCANGEGGDSEPNSHAMPLHSCTESLHTPAVFNRLETCRRTSISRFWLLGHCMRCITVTVAADREG